MNRERDLEVYNEYIAKKTAYYYINAELITEALEIVTDEEVRSKLLHELTLED